MHILSEKIYHFAYFMLTVSNDRERGCSTFFLILICLTCDGRFRLLIRKQFQGEHWYVLKIMERIVKFSYIVKK